MCFAAWRHGDRFAIDELPAVRARLAGRPGEELVHRHACRRGLAKCDHAGRIAPLCSNAEPGGIGTPCSPSMCRSTRMNGTIRAVPGPGSFTARRKLPGTT